MRTHQSLFTSSAQLANYRLIQAAYFEIVARLRGPSLGPTIPTSTQVCAELWKMGAAMPIDEIVHIAALAGLALEDMLGEPEEPTRRLNAVRL